MANNSQTKYDISMTVSVDSEVYKALLEAAQLGVLDPGHIASMIIEGCILNNDGHVPDEIYQTLWGPDDV